MFLFNLFLANTLVCSQFTNLAICVCKDGFTGIYCETGQSITTASGAVTPAGVVATTQSSGAIVTPNSGTGTSSFSTCPSTVTVCKNGGACLYETSTNFITCVCPTGFTQSNTCDKNI